MEALQCHGYYTHVCKNMGIQDILTEGVKPTSASVLDPKYYVNCIKNHNVFLSMGMLLVFNVLTTILILGSGYSWSLHNLLYLFII